MVDIIDKATAEINDFTESSIRACRTAANRQHLAINSKICENCGKPINPARLEAVPGTCFCIDCQKELEREYY